MQGLCSATPITQELRAILSNHIAGYIPHAEDKAAPSRAFAKVIEAELRLGHQIERGQTCVDLGASPGSWSYVAIQRGAHVIAIDRSPLRDDLMRSPRLKFTQADAFKFKPETPVDWLICDIIAAPQRSIDLLLEWLREKQMRRFIVTLKFKGTDEYHLMDQLKQEAPPLCADFRLTRLCANKNEVTAFGLTCRLNTVHTPSLGKSLKRESRLQIFASSGIDSFPESNRASGHTPEISHVRTQIVKQLVPCLSGIGSGFRRHRHEPALRAQRMPPSRETNTRRSARRARAALADVLVTDHHGLLQVPRLHYPRDQSR
jgi:23S rRNA U2552 (ribose-2'-O)-methylase RlmE/FtsJ